MSAYDSSDDSSPAQLHLKELDFESLIEESNSVLKRLKEEQAAERQNSGAHGASEYRSESYQEATEIEEPVISDSEGENSIDDPFRQLITLRKRSVTEPPKSSIRGTREIKRPKTETSAFYTTWTPLSMESSQPSDLVDTSYAQNEFTELQDSSQSNVTVYMSQAIDSGSVSRKPVVDDDNKVIRNPNVDTTIDQQNCSRYNETKSGYNVIVQDFEKETSPTLQKSCNRNSENTKTYDKLENKKTISMTSNNALDGDVGFQVSTHNVLQTDNDTHQPITDNDKEEKGLTETPHIVLPSNRSTKRKSTLTHLCAKNVPYRVGLSRKANITHLHSYLTKK